MADKIFADGLSAKKVATQYGDIIKLGINYDKFVEFLAKYQNEKGYVNVDIKTGQSGKLYAELNTYKSKPVEVPIDEPTENIVQFEGDEEISF